MQWLLLLAFTLSTCLFRLACYTLLFLHLNLFLLPAGGILLISLGLHIILRGVSDRFYVSTRSGSPN